MRVKVIFAGLVTLLFAAAGVRPDAQTQDPQTPDTSTERKLELKFDGKGYATLVAQNVSVSDIFAAWAKDGGTKITNADKLPRGLISVQFDRTPEQKLVESLVRLSKAQNPGFIAVPRRLDGPVTPSVLQAIGILPTSSPTQSYTTTSSNVAPLYQQNSDDEVPPVMPVVGGGPASQPAPRPQPPPTTGGPGAPVVPVGGPGTPSIPPAPLPGSTGRGGGRGL